jgi:hypothetical protein
MVKRISEFDTRLAVGERLPRRATAKARAVNGCYLVAVTA